MAAAVAERRHRLAVLDVAAAEEAARHGTFILDTYFRELLPAGSAIIQYESVAAEIDKAAARNQVFKMVPKTLVRICGDNSMRSGDLEKLQTIAREILNESLQHGGRYPLELLEW